MAGRPATQAAMLPPDEQLARLRRGAVEIISERELLEKLSRKTPLVIKAGFDPTAPDLHLGHTVLLRKLRQFQDLGHKVKFLIGDATALVGDPSGQSVLRKLMMPVEVERNAATYLQQVRQLLRTDDEKVFHLQYNSEWFGRSTGSKPFGLPELIKLASKYTVARLIERDDFQKRMKAGQEVSMLELFYPLMQGYDSVMMQADVELGGTDQKFNLLVGRDLQRAYGQEPQVVMTLPLLVGTDGVQKMSKSLGNHIGITDAPNDMFGKLMSVPDAAMESYVTLLTDLDWVALKTQHPKAAKVALAKAVVAQYHGAAAADEAAAGFDKVFRQKELPAQMPQLSVASTAVQTIGQLYEHAADALKQHINISSKSELRRIINQRGLKVDGQVVGDANAPLTAGTHTLQAGPRRFLQVHLK